MKLTTLVFSKNRACQLELLLRSMNYSPAVLYTFDRGFEKGYEQLIKMYPKVKFIKETNFKAQLTELVKKSKYLYLPTDDTVMIDSFSENSNEFKEFIANKNIASLSLGLSAEVAGKKWKWLDFKGNYRLRMWAYPVSIDSCIIRSEDVMDALSNYGGIPTPNYLEMALLAKLPNRPYMTCFDKRKIINNSVNQVQKDFPAHTFGITAEQLEKNFLEGRRLSLSDIKEKSKSAKIYRVKIPYSYEHT